MENFDFTRCEGFSLPQMTANTMAKLDSSKKHPINGKILSRTMGPPLAFLSGIVNAVAHLSLALLKAPVALLLAPYNLIAKRKLPRDLEINSVFVHMFKAAESVFQAGMLPLAMALDPKSAKGFSNLFNMTRSNRKEIEEQNLKIQEFKDVIALNKEKDKFKDKSLNSAKSMLINEKKNNRELRRENTELKREKKNNEVRQISEKNRDNIFERLTEDELKSIGFSYIGSVTEDDLDRELEEMSRAPIDFTSSTDLEGCLNSLSYSQLIEIQEIFAQS